MATTKKKPAKKAKTKIVYRTAPKKKAKKKTKKKKGFADAFTHQRLAVAVKQTLFAMGGGVAATGVRKATEKLDVLPRVGIMAALGFVLIEVAGYTNMGAGFIGGSAALETQEPVNKMLSEWGIGEGAAAKYADTNSVNQLPLTLNDGGQILSLMEDGNGTYCYMNENNGAIYLAEDIYPNYMPRY